ncbi:catalase [Oxalobacteraceae bacterium]|nr:catalase [Oxalobacteraceae bacterium]
MSIGAITPSSAYSAPSTAASPAPAREAPARAQSATELTPAALALIDKLKSRDTEVRQHEQAHLAAAGGLAVSGASYTYQRGPNGIDYAVGGEVHIDTAPGRTPEETIARAHTIQAAALAPAEPSGADRSVAAQAQQLEQQARAELAVQQTEAALAPAQQTSQQSLNRAYGVTPPAPPTVNVFA